MGDLTKLQTSEPIFITDDSAQQVGVTTVAPSSSSVGLVVRNIPVTTTDNTQSTGLTAAGTVAVSTNGCGTAYLTLTGNGAGMAFTIQGQDGNGNWNNVAALTLAGAIVTAGTTLSANGQWLVPCAGFQAVRANLTAITSGTATFNWEAGSGTQVVGVINTVTTSPTGTQTTAPTGTQTVAGTVTANAGTGTLAIAGDVASGTNDSGNPVKMGGVAHTTIPTAVSDAQRVNAYSDKFGRHAVVINQVRDLVSTGAATLTNTTETTIISAGGTGVFLDLVGIFLSNTSSTAVRIDLRDSTGGTVRISYELAATGGGVALALPVPYPQATANNAWTAQLSATVTDVRVTLLACQNK